MPSGEASNRKASGHAEPSYKDSGVDVQGAESSIRELAKWIDLTFTLNPCRPALPLGYYANVIPLTKDLAIAISTDGVGTKILVAEEMDKYDTVGIDCVAMNANDIVCVGATPVTLVDYVAVERADPHFLGEIGKGLYEGARQAGISIPGGELAQVREMIRGKRPDKGFDLVGTCVGTLHPDRIVVGEDVAPGDVVVALPSSGMHSNGFTLARRVLLEKAGLSLDAYAADLGRTLGEELLTPTHIYVREAVEMLASVRIKALAHITGDGLLNVARVKNRSVGFVFDRLAEVPPIFSMIRRLGDVSLAEMFLVFNMGVGFCIVVAPEDADRVIAIADRHGRKAAVVGYAVADDERRIWVPQHRLEGSRGEFRSTSALPPRNPRS
jgi:phosphoribosylformylglycinamidine cyclo-ligase